MSTSAQLDIGLLCNDAPLVARIEAIASECGYSLQIWQDLEVFMSEPRSPLFVIASLKDNGAPMSAAELAQACRFTCKEAFILCTVSGSLAKEDAAFSKRSGANSILLEQELFETSKLEFILTQTLRSRYLPLKSSDLVAGHHLHFDLFHLLPQREKFLKIARSGDTLDCEQLQRITAAGELYIPRQHADGFKRFTEEVTDLSALGLAKRCRAQFLALSAGFSRLVFQLTDQSEHGSFKEGQALLKECQKLCSDLQASLSENGRAWEVINLSSVGELGTIERSPSIASYVGLFGLRMQLPKVDELMLAALLADLGLLFLHPSILLKLREERLSDLEPSELESYRNYPMRGLNSLLDRKLAIPDELRRTLLSTQERSDGTGFPKGVPGNRLSTEAQLIHFCRHFDQRILLKMGRPRAKPAEELEKMLSIQELATDGRYNPKFIEQLRRSVVDLLPSQGKKP